MNDFLQQYFDYGLSDIVEFDRKICEPSPIEKETTVFVAARKTKQYVVARLKLTATDFLTVTTDSTITHELITQAQYEEYAN